MRGQDVLLLTDPIDEFMLPSLHEYKGKKLQAADRGELPAEKPAADEVWHKLFIHLKAKLAEVSSNAPVKSVEGECRVSRRW